ncbi:hypothetical protein CPJCM30710_09840 [Clostridium polyendosporum]|uniref:Uncharacterized protein n=1 Tax=Clostridium polyendosporum TaxID=69208 RepID=A0A919RZ89_9CLOT|nr:hypothetical protein [Clostridium polyendosporum]GIM28318.1 hypothetical protein CPJCM30710_09840 [Clostridium polyendosporum]
MSTINSDKLIEIRSQYNNMVERFAEMEPLIRKRLDLVATTCHGGQYCHGGTAKTPDFDNPINKAL